MPGHTKYKIPIESSPHIATLTAPRFAIFASNASPRVYKFHGCGLRTTRVQRASPRQRNRRPDFFEEKISFVVFFSCPVTRVLDRPPILLGLSHRFTNMRARSNCSQKQTIITFWNGLIPMFLDNAADCYKLDEGRVDSQNLRIRAENIMLTKQKSVPLHARSFPLTSPSTTRNPQCRRRSSFSISGF